jgi:alpha-L-fucosidase
MPVLKPTPEQLAWQRMRLGVFFRFGLNTFHGLEWGDGTIQASDFAPDGLDADQWVATAAELGAEYVVVTAKHHDGFCLWPTATTDYSVASSPWRAGTGDVVREVADACARRGLRFGFYLSPWDRHAPEYADPAAYDDLYEAQLRELCTNYGDVVEIWFDGAGSEGHVYAWDRFVAVIEALQPNAMVFNMGAPTIRWVGNEDGLANDPVDYVVAQANFSNYTVDTVEFEQALYLPPECDVSLRRGWFWAEDDEPKSLDHLIGIYYRSIGMGANLLLNLPPDSRGLIPEGDIARLREFRAELDRRFAVPIASRLERGPETAEGADVLHEVVADFGPDTVLDHVVLQEDLDDGQRAIGFEISADGEVLGRGMRIGAQRFVVFPETSVGRLTVRIFGAGARLAEVTGFRTGATEVPAISYAASTDAPL